MDPFTAIMVGTAVVSTGLSIWGTISGAQAQEEAAQRKQALANAQANEMMERELINEQIMREKSAEAQSGYRASWGSSGKEGGGIGGVLKMQKDLAENISLSRRDAEYKANMLRAGAQMETDLYSDRVTASYITGAGTLIGGVGQGFQIYDKYKAPKV